MSGKRNADDVDSLASELVGAVNGTDVARVGKQEIVRALTVEIAAARSRKWTYQQISDFIFDRLGERISHLTIKKVYQKEKKKIDVKAEVAKVAPIRRRRASGNESVPSGTTPSAGKEAL